MPRRQQLRLDLAPLDVAGQRAGGDHPLNRPRRHVDASGGLGDADKLHSIRPTTPDAQWEDRNLLR